MKTSLKKRYRLIFLIALMAVLAAYSYHAVRRPLPDLKPAVSQAQLQSHTLVGKFAWPNYGSAALGLVGADEIVTNGTQKSLPTASTAKILTVLSVLHKKPLTPGQPGPTITLTDADVAIYEVYVAHNGSVVPVRSGEQITEYQMLQAILLPSANNLADSLAIWAFGSLSAYRTYAADYAHQLGLSDTKVGSDASGLAPDSTSTAHDLVLLGKAAMRNPVLAAIVSQASASDIPNVGAIDNVNYLLGTSGIVGIKTGNTDQAGGVFLSASKTIIDGRPVTIVTAVLGAPNLGRALSDSLPLIRSAQTNFSANTLIQPNNVVGHYDVPWGGRVTALSKTALTVTAWNGAIIPVSIRLDPIKASARSGQTIGVMTAQQSQVSNQINSPIVLSKAPPPPSIWWRLQHGF
ncbi:MAG: hypothetical protein ABI602_04395 [Candidatus Saccharibacteria bacterium]